MHLALRKHIQRHRIGLLIIDYLQLMQTTGSKENRTQEVTEISRGMKLAAREFNVPVIVLAQFNRGPAATKREPELHDLRDSGSIEQDSDKVIFLHRKADLETSMIVAKQRNGKSRKYVDLLFVERHTRFEELEKGIVHQGDAA
jgi:replicative DNA helicase